MRLNFLEFVVASTLSLAIFLSAWDGDLETAGALGIACIAIIVIGASRSHGLLHPLTLMLFASGAYIAAGPIELLLFPNVAGLSPEPVLIVLANGIVFLLFARFSGLAVVDHKCEQCRPGHWVHGSWLGVEAIWVATAAATAAAVAEIAVYGLDIGSISRADIYANQSAALSAARIVAASLTVIGYAGWRNAIAGRVRLSLSTRIGFVGALALLAAAELLILGDRRLLLSVMLGMACAHGIKHVPVYVFVASIPMLAILLAYGFVRNRPLEEWSSIFDSLDALQALSPSNLEFGGFLVVAEYVLTATVIPEDFPRYASAILQVVPRGLLPDRPEAPSEWFARTFFPDWAAQGYGYGFNAIVESLVNFGPAGPVLLGIASGCVLSFAGRDRLTAGLAGFLGVFLMRLDLASLLKTAVLASASVAIAFGACLALKALVRGSLRVPRPPEGIA